MNIVVGKYQSDRLSLEVLRLRYRMDDMTPIPVNTTNEVLTDCKALLEQLAEIMGNNRQEKITIEDFATEK